MTTERVEAIRERVAQGYHDAHVVEDRAFLLAQLDACEAERDRAVELLRDAWKRWMPRQIVKFGSGLDTGWDAWHATRDFLASFVSTEEKHDDGN